MHSFKSLAIVIATTFLVSNARAGLVPPSFTGTPKDSWSYFELPAADLGGDINYFATTLTEFKSAPFQGYVTYNFGVPPFAWLGTGNDSVEVFETYVRSSVDITIPIVVGADDGHSLFLNNVFIGGHGFGPGVNHDLVLKAGIPVLIDVVGYNAGGPWEFLLVDQNGAVLNSYPTLELNAIGQFSVVPEPTTYVLLSMGLGVIFSVSLFRKFVLTS